MTNETRENFIPAAKYLLFRSLPKKLLYTIYAVILLINPLFAQQKRVFTHQDSLRGSLNPARMYDVKYYDLKLKIDPVKQYLHGENTITFMAMQDLDSIQIDLSSILNVNTINFESSSLRFRREGDHIFAYLPERIAKGSVAEVTVPYEGMSLQAVKPPWEGGFVWKTDSTGSPWVGVACEGIGASMWWPCKDYLGDEPDSMSIQCTVPSGLQCICNGRLSGSYVNVNNTNTYLWKVNYPINTYDVTLNIGNYKQIRETHNSEGQNINMDFYFLPYHLERAKQYFPSRTEEMLQCFEKYFGPYPFPKDGYGLVETSYWGMEHQGAIAYGNNFKNSTLGLPFDFILIHETAHEWWGNSLSCKDEAEMWLHESFATYAEAIYVEWKFGHGEMLKYLEKQKKNIGNKEPLIGPLGVNYRERVDNDIYYKGSWMLHTLRNVINDDSLWFAVIRSYAERYKRSFVSSEDFIRHVNEMTGKNYSVFFEQYLRRAKLPVLEYTLKKKSSKTTLRYRWVTDVKGFAMPLAISAGEFRTRITPGNKWKKLKIPLGNANVDLGENLFLFTSKDLGLPPKVIEADF